MSFTRLMIIAAIFASAGLWALGVQLIPSKKSGAYATLVCSEEVPDREIRKRLEDQGITGLISESGQWVLLDCFGSIERVALDEYQARILPFDPRNDGYADKLRSLFVHDGRRFVYIPLQSFTLKIIEKRLAVALGGIPYSFEYALHNAGARRPPGLALVVLFLALCAFFVFRPVRRALKPHAASLVPCLLTLSPLALGNTAGFAMASLLAGFAVLAAGLFLERLRLFRMVRWLLPPLLLLCYGLLAVFSGLPLVFTLPVLAIFCGILLLSLRAASRSASGLSFMRRKPGHRRFSPVLILKPRSSGFAFAWAMLPFAAAALICVCVSFAASFSRARSDSVLPSAAVTEADYYAHCLFQAGFSQRTLHAPSAAEELGGMNRYEMASDGLIDFSFHEEDPALVGVAPFPLTGLVRYLESVHYQWPSNK